MFTTHLCQAIVWLAHFLCALSFRLQFSPVPVNPVVMNRMQSSTYPWRIVEWKNGHVSSLWAVWTHNFRRWFHLVDHVSVWQVTPNGQLLVYFPGAVGSKELGTFEYYELQVQHGQWIRLSRFSFPTVQQLSTCTEGNQWLVLTETGRYYMFSRDALVKSLTGFSKQAVILDSVRLMPPSPQLLPFGISYFRNLLAIVHSDPLQTLLYESEVNLFTVYRLRLTDVMSQPHQLLHIHDHMDASFLWVLDRDDNQSMCHAWMLPLHPESQPLYSLPGDRFTICFPWIVAVNLRLESWALYRHGSSCDPAVSAQKDLLKPVRTGVLPLPVGSFHSVLVDVDSQGQLWWFMHNTWFVL